MKRQKVVEKFIIVGTSNSGTTAASSIISFGSEITYPGTIFGLHYEVVASLTSDVSTRAHVNWAFYIRRKDQPNMDLQARIPATVLPLWQTGKGNNEDTLVSGTNYVVREIIPDNGLMEHSTVSRGQVRTERKVKVGDQLMLAKISDAVLGVTLAWQVTYWKRS